MIILRVLIFYFLVAGHCRRQFLGWSIQESPIFIKTYDFTKWLLEHTIRFPKSQRFVVGKRIKEDHLLQHRLSNAYKW
jgi:hypothetical protein